MGTKVSWWRWGRPARARRIDCSSGIGRPWANRQSWPARGRCGWLRRAAAWRTSASGLSPAALRPVFRQVLRRSINWQRPSSRVRATPVLPIGGSEQRELVRRLVHSTLEHGELSCFAATAHSAGFVELVIELIQELQRRGIAPEHFAESTSRRQRRRARRVGSALHQLSSDCWISTCWPTARRCNGWPAMNWPRAVALGWPSCGWSWSTALRTSQRSSMNCCRCSLRGRASCRITLPADDDSATGAGRNCSQRRVQPWRNSSVGIRNWPIHYAQAGGERGRRWIIWLRTCLVIRGRLRR